MEGWNLEVKHRAEKAQRLWRHTPRRSWRQAIWLGASVLALAAPLAYAIKHQQPQPDESHGHAVRTGIDVLESHDFAEIATTNSEAGYPKTTRVALVTNQTGVDSEGRRTIDVLAGQAAKTRGIELTAIFSPEHGVHGNQETDSIADSTDAATGLPVYSVYGNTDAKRRPSPEILKTVDTIVFDIQDIGARFYTYETTLGYFLEAAARTGTSIVVLDRPNPINGTSVQGPVSDAGRESFTNYASIPVRHGMTIGELALYYNSERGIGARLTVVRMEGWKRSDWMDETGLAWVNPSPNIRSLTAATLYPGVALLETTNLSVGRGTETPFELVGAPWIDGRKLAKYMKHKGIHGVRFIPAEFTPETDRQAKFKCGGVKIVLTDRDALDSPQLGVELAAAIRKLFPMAFNFTKLDRLMVNAATTRAIITRKNPRKIAQRWRKPLEEFRARRAKYLLY
jgi:uncharacterized protein YbbC (DUF1343 family)